MDSILDYKLSIVKEKSYLIQTKIKKKIDLPTYLRILKLMGSSIANKEYFKNGLGMCHIP